MKYVQRPERVVTDRNSTVADRAAAWGMVERALGAVNTEAERLQVPEVTALAEAMSAYHYVCGSFPPGGEARAQAWDRAVKAQFALLMACASLQWVDPMYATMDELRLAREYYLEIGGSAQRAPMVGGIA